MIILTESIVDFFYSLLTQNFMQYALIAGLIVGILAPLIGTVVVIRRLSFIADTLSHFSLAGIALGVFLSKLIAGKASNDFLAQILGIIFSILGTLIIEELRSFYKNYKELSMPIVLALGVALSNIFISVSESSGAIMQSLLFGSIYSVNKVDLILILWMTIIIFTFIIVYSKQIITLCFDETYAKVTGVNVKGLQLMITIILAIFISIFMDIIGVLLISALMIIPVAASILIGDSFKSSIIFSIIFSEISVCSGFIFSYIFPLPTGACIVLMNTIILFLIMFSKSLKKK